VNASSHSQLDVNAQRIVDALSEPLVVVDLDLRVQYANPAFYTLFATAPDPALGNSLFQFISGPPDLDVLDSLQAVVRSGGHHRSVERGSTDSAAVDDQPGKVEQQSPPIVEGIEIDGTFGESGRRVFQFNGRMIDAEDAPPRLLLGMEALTEQRRLEETLRERGRKLERSHADLEQFAYAASHALQKPLRMISSDLPLLEHRYGDSLENEARDFMNDAVDGTQRMNNLINGLLRYSRVERKEGAWALRPVDLNEVFSRVRSDLQHRIEALGATVASDLLPTVFGHPGQLQRLLKNLLENALTYHGEDAPSIQVTATSDEDRKAAPLSTEAHVMVRDEGPGIQPEHQETVFQLFKQLDPHGGGKEGSGMGLALCRKIAERHDGAIWIESTPGEGTDVHVTLGLSPESPAD
jgi:signal transduction histidine kinase